MSLATLRALADTITLSPSKDNTLILHPEGAANSNGAGTGVFSGRAGNHAGAGALLRGVLAFDVAGAIPEGSTITNASLTLMMIQTTSFDQVHRLHRLLADWGEGESKGFGGLGAPATPGSATWLHTFFPDQYWSNNGGDFVAKSTAEQTVGLPGPYTWTSPQMSIDIQNWLDSPCTNFGWILIGNELQLMTAKRFGSREAELASDWPALLIEYVPGLPPCAADVWPPPDSGGGNGVEDVDELLVMINSWGPCSSSCCDADIAGGETPGSGDGVVNVDDLLAVINSWGPCP